MTVLRERCARPRVAATPARSFMKPGAPMAPKAADRPAAGAFGETVLRGPTSATAAFTVLGGDFFFAVRAGGTATWT